jgi:hypothetical protein
MYRIYAAGKKPLFYAEQCGNRQKAFNPLWPWNRRGDAVASEVGDELIEADAKIDHEKEVEPLNRYSERLHEAIAHSIKFLSLPDDFATYSVASLC